MAEAREQTVWLRWIIPFLQVTGIDPRQIASFVLVGAKPIDLTDPNVRLPHSVARKLLELALSTRGDPALGLEAGRAVDAASLDVVVLAARSCATLREGIACANRYMSLFDESVQARLIETESSALWQLSTTLGRPEMDDFLLAAAYALACQCAARPIELLQVHFRHAGAPDAAACARAFGKAEIRHAKAHNALVFPQRCLDTPLAHAHSGLQAVYELRAQALQARLDTPENTTARVRELAAAQLRLGDASMTTVARKLGVSVATLRRRLQNEDQVFSRILDDVRRELAQEHLGNPSLPMAEIAKLLGFSHVAAFYRAFRRWFRGTTPARLRARLRRGEAPDPAEDEPVAQACA